MGLFLPEDQKELDELLKPKGKRGKNIFVYSNADNIFALDGWDSKPVSIYQISKDDDAFCLCYHDSGLYCGTSGGQIYEVLNNEYIDGYSSGIVSFASVNDLSLYSVDEDCCFRHVVGKYGFDDWVDDRDEIVNDICGYRGLLYDGTASGIYNTTLAELVYPTDKQVVAMETHDGSLFWGGFETGIRRVGSTEVWLGDMNIHYILSHNSKLLCVPFDRQNEVWDVETNQLLFSASSDMYGVSSVPRELL